jgi:hypothetical protein
MSKLKELTRLGNPLSVSVGFQNQKQAHAQIKSMEARTKERGSNFHPVRNSPGQNLIPTGSKIHPVTGSKFDPFKDTIKNNFKKNLSQSEPELSEAISEYFENLRPQAKHERELQAFENLKAEFSPEQIASSLLRVTSQSFKAAKGEIHSPMRFLESAIGDVLGELESKSSRRQSEPVPRSLDPKVEEEQRAEIEQAEREMDEAWKYFQASVPDPEAQEQIIHGIFEQKPALGFLPGAVAEKVAVLEWVKCDSNR